MHTYIVGLPNYQMPKALGEEPQFPLIDDSDGEYNNKDLKIMLYKFEGEI